MGILIDAILELEKDDFFKLTQKLNLSGFTRLKNLTEQLSISLATPSHN